MPRKHFLGLPASLLSLIVTASWGLACGQQARTPVSVPSQRALSVETVKVVNIVPDFLSFWIAAQSKDEATQVTLFRQMVIQPHAELFAENVVDLGQKQGTEAENRRIAAYLKQVLPFLPAIRILNDRLQSDLQTYTANFVTVFPDYHPSTPVYFTVSLGSFDGGTREVNGHTALLFGVDVIAGLYGPDAKLSVLFDHELFHQYHASLDLPSSNDDGELWQSLWEEGLATYVSWRMNPSADENDVLLNKTLAGRARPMLPSLAAGLLRHSRSKDPEEYKKYFLGMSGSHDNNFPARTGYFVGFLVASHIGQSSTPFTLAHLHGVDLRNQVEQALRELAAPPSARK